MGWQDHGLSTQKITQRKSPRKLSDSHPEDTGGLPSRNCTRRTILLDSIKYLRRALRNLYHYRWSEEEFFKTIKKHLQAEEFRGKSVQFIDQELLSTYLYYILMLEATRQHDIPLATLETKAALVALARYLDRLWIAETLDQCQELLRRCLAEISRRKNSPKPGRKFPRKSKSRYGKWPNTWALVNGIAAIQAHRTGQLAPSLLLLDQLIIEAA